MNIQAVRIEETVDLETMSSKTCVVFRLPTGKYFRATVDDEEGMQFIVEAAAQGAKDWAPEATRTDVPPPPLPQVAPMPTPADYEGEEKVIWSALPHDILSPLMKAAFTKLGVAPELTMQAVHAMMDSVMSSFGPNDWAVVRSDEPLEVQAEVQPVATAQPAPTPKPSPANTLPLGKVAWADGSPMLPGMGTPSRTVPSDEFGYPVTPGEADPGEAIGGSNSGNADEDGVEQF